MKITVLTQLLVLLLVVSGCSESIESTKKVESSNEQARVKQEKTYRIFVLHSYESDHVCGMPQGQGIIEILNNKYGDENIIWDFYYMNTKVKNTNHASKQKEADHAIKRIKEFKPDVLFVLDDNAINYVAMELINEPFYIIFSGMNGQPEKYDAKVDWLDDNNSPSKNMTGVYEFLHSVKSFELISKLFPKKKKIIALIDNTPTGNAITKQLELELKDADLQIKVEVNRLSTMKEYKEFIRKINRDKSVAAVYNIALGLKQGKESVGVGTTFKYFIENSNKPGIALNYAFSKLGLFGGAAVDFKKMGEQTAEMAISLLEGKPISELPVQSAKKYMIIFNKARAEQLNIKLPPDIELAADEIYDVILLTK